VAEPPSAEARAGVLHELGLLEAAAGHPDALDHLAQALADGLAPEQRPIALAMRARVALYRDPPAAFEELQTALAEARDPGLALRLEATALDATMYDLALFDRRPELLARPGEPSPARLAHMAIDAGYAPEHRDEVDALARRALAAGDLSALLGAESAAVHLLVQAVRNVELPALAAELVDAMEAAARREGSRIGLFMASHARAFWNWWFGSLSTAEAHARAGLEVTEAAGLNVARFSMLIILAEVLRERGNLDEAEALLATVTFGAAEENSIIGPDFLAARGLVHWLRARRDDAEHDLRRATELLWARGWRNPLKGRAALRLAELLAEQGRTHEARELASGELDTARAAAIPGAEGMALRVLGRVEASEELHRSAVERLEQSAMALERAWALHDPGAHQRRGGRRIDARDTLRAALDIADRHGAGELGDLVRAELVQAGARPRRSAAIGPESLTPSERRVAELAARGLSNREIAETLWVTRKTVEVHLGHTYSKLGIRTRGELPAALAGGS
jgi:DNA-binding CsgD family transcriptional regulator